jgi:hydrogenase maturation protease
MKTLVLGIGNPFYGDQGIGVHAARRLLREGVPTDCEVLDVGTDIFDALPSIEKAERIIIVDAVSPEDKSGSVYRIPLRHCNSAACIDSMHSFFVFGVLAMARYPIPEIVILGVAPSETGWKLDLSPQASRAMPALIHAIRMEIDRNLPDNPPMAKCMVWYGEDQRQASVGMH